MDPVPVTVMSPESVGFVAMVSALPAACVTLAPFAAVIDDPSASVIVVLSSAVNDPGPLVFLSVSEPNTSRAAPAFTRIAAPLSTSSSATPATTLSSMSAVLVPSAFTLPPLAIEMTAVFCTVTTAPARSS